MLMKCLGQKQRRQHSLHHGQCMCMSVGTVCWIPQCVQYSTSLLLYFPFLCVPNRPGRCRKKNKKSHWIIYVTLLLHRNSTSSASKTQKAPLNVKCVNIVHNYSLNLLQPRFSDTPHTAPCASVWKVLLYLVLKQQERLLKYLWL